MTARRFLFVCHDAGGTIPPVIALAEALVGHGHAVTVLSQPSVQARAVAAGAEFAAFSAIPSYVPGVVMEEQLSIAGQVVVGRGAGDDLIALAHAKRADLVVVDANFGGALAAAETMVQPSVVLLHSMYKTFVDTWLGALWPMVGDPINDTRSSYGLGPAANWTELFRGHAGLLPVVPEVFDVPVAAVPTSSMLRCGFPAPRAASAAPIVEYPPGDGPAVLLTFSTTHHHYEQLMRSIVEVLSELPVRALVTTAGVVTPAALGGAPNVTVTEYVPHAHVLAETDLMVTHAGLGSVAAVLSFGVPLVCLPIGRDQPLNAGRVADLGAGLTIDPATTADVISDAITQVLADGRFRQAAGAIAEASRLEGGPAAAATALAAMLD